MYTRQILEAIASAANCGITVNLTLAKSEDQFHRASARHTQGDGHECICMRSDPVRAIEGAINTLVGKPADTQLQ